MPMPTPTPPSDMPSALTALAARMREIFDEGEPAVLRQVAPVFDPAEVFAWVKAVHNPAQANFAREKLIALKASWGVGDPEAPDPSQPQPGRSAELYRHAGSLVNPGPYLPDGDDTFASWVARTREALGGDFGLMAPGIECASWDAMERLRALLEPTLAATGPRSYRYNVFAGDYRRTPFGFHLDPHQEAVFQVVLTGTRRAMFWEGLALSEPDAAWLEDSNGRVAPQRTPDLAVDLAPGDVVFWPGTQVHGMEADGPSLALSIVIDRASPRRRAEVESALQVSSLQGVAAVPPVMDPGPIAPETRLRRRAGMRLRWERYDDTLILGVCGRTIDWPHTFSIPEAVAMLEWICARPRFHAREVIEACALGQLDAQDIANTLGTLASLGYLALDETA